MIPAENSDKGLREDARRYLQIIDGLLRLEGRAGVGDFAQETGLTFGKACSAVCRLDREHLVRHVPRSGIFMTEQGRAMLGRHAG